MSGRNGTGVEAVPETAWGVLAHVKLLWDSFQRPGAAAYLFVHNVRPGEVRVSLACAQSTANLNGTLFSVAAIVAEGTQPGTSTRLAFSRAAAYGASGTGAPVLVT